MAVVPAKDEEERVGATIAALRRIPAVTHVVVVDDGSSDQTATVAEWAGGVDVVRHGHNRGKSAALETGAARAAELAPGAPLLFADADLQDSAANLSAVVEPVLAGMADMTIAVLPPQDRPGGGFGIVVRTAREGISRLTGWAPQQPLSGQRCLTREAFDGALPLAAGWGVEVGLTIDVLRGGGRVMEVPCELHHRVTGRDLGAQVHRARQLADVARAVADRSGVPDRVREGGLAGARVVREQTSRLAGQARERGGPLVERAKERGAPLVDRARERGGPTLDQVRRRLRGGWHEL
ncbi:Glycosyl transferase family 2 [Ornithinimicrobium cerasi]|uniref:Glucosyl-3-phosphoglycerate synthase n=1 Tax=Ornithinimicrobium cerasi TaxID=2248773 RepID=A0A285VTS2_9MICO|nr:Glycosyl transferase family 2 [Ornithinimicrobium cerasi]